MNLTYIFGNGYDIQLGLETQYRQFYSTISEEKKERNQIYRAIAKKPEDWADFELALGKYTCSIDDQVWGTDFENKLIDDLEEVNEDLSEYLAKEQQKLAEFKGDTTEYLRFTLADFFANYPAEYTSKLKIKLNNYQRESYVINFLTLNYTNSLEILLQNCPTEFRMKNNSGYSTYLKPTIHLHGTLNFHQTLGVNDSSQLSSKMTSKNVRLFIKPELLELSGESMKREGQKIISESNFIIIFGASIGETDKTWWQEVANVIKANNCYVVLHIFDPAITERSTRRQIMKREEITNKFLSHIESLTDELEQKIRENLFVVFNKELFKYIDLKAKQDEN